MESRIQFVASADGVRIAYTSSGEGDPLVCVANVWGDLELARQRGKAPIYGGLWDALIRNHFQFVVYDGRGSGSSDRHVQDMSQAARLHDLEAIVDRLQLERFALLGVVHACSTAITYASMYPDRVSKLVLEAPYARGADFYARAPMLRAIRALGEMAEDNWEFFTLTLTNWLTHFNSEAAADLAVLYRKAMEPDDYRRLVASFEGSDVTDRLALVQAPTLVVQDAQSPFSQTAGTATLTFSERDFLREIVAAIPNAELVSVQNRVEMVDSIMRFLRGDGAITSTSSEASRLFRSVLFTDLVGHTEMMSRLGDERGRAVLREHESITRDVLKQHGGTEVKTMGDGFMASFGSVTKAVECAVALQRAFAERDGEPLNVRVGLNAGEPIEEEGDLFGATVILASRIAARAGAGQIFVADTVRGLCSGKGFLFADRGEFVAKGFEEPVRVYEVSWRS
jgi:class 3 adenylate cyclase/pimeloyl-ACP methyl ester carboxylesterase